MRWNLNGAMSFFKLMYKEFSYVSLCLKINHLCLNKQGKKKKEFVSRKWYCFSLWAHLLTNYSNILRTILSNCYNFQHLINTMKRVVSFVYHFHNIFITLSIVTQPNFINIKIVLLVVIDCHQLWINFHWKFWNLFVQGTQ